MVVTSREEYEAFYKPRAGSIFRHGIDGSMWEVWQAAYEAGRTAERSACADVCDGVATAPHPILQTALKCAEAIRARGKP